MKILQIERRPPDSILDEEHTKKTCKSFWPRYPGGFTCKANHIKMKHIPAKIEEFYEREEHISRLVRHLLQENNVILNLIGLPGSGKSALVRNTIHYLGERKYFSSGILSIPLASITSVTQMLHILRRIISEQLSIPAAHMARFLKRTSQDNECLEFIIKVFQDNYSGHSLKKHDKNF